MPTIINPYGNSQTMGQDLFGLGGVADAFFGPKAATSAYTREKFKEQQRQNLGVEDLATLLRNPNADPGAMAAAAARGGVAYNNLGGYNLFGVAGRNPNPTDPRVLQAQTQAQVPFAQTATGDAAHLANARTIAQQQADKQAATQLAITDRTVIPVVGPDGRTTYSRTVDAPGQGAPVSYDQARGGALVRNWSNLGGLDAFQQNVVNADVTPRNWFAPPAAPGQPMRQGRVRPDGTDEATGQPLPPNAVTGTAANPGGSVAFQQPLQPGATEQKDYRSAVRHADQTIQLGGKIKEIVDRNPTAIGPVGNLRLLGQEGLDLLNSLNMQFGGGRPGGYDASVVQTRAALTQRYGDGVARLLPELFDSDLNSVRTMNGMLIYKAAAALGQSGRDASDKDIQFVRQLTGDPGSWWQGPTGYKDKITQLMNIIQTQRDDDYGRLQGQSVIPPGGTGAPTVTGGGGPPGTTAAPGSAAVPPPLPPGFVPD